jgi:hypothetical protein
MAVHFRPVQELSLAYLQIQFVSECASKTASAF